jgi:hypothetical protein
MTKWNHSLDVSARTCQRRVFLRSRYASHQSAKGSARHEAYLLKQALDLAAWRGRLVHLAAKNWVFSEIKQRQWPNFDMVRKLAVDLVYSQAAFSSSGLYRTSTKSAAADSYCVLRADLLGEGLTGQQLEAMCEGVVASLTVLEKRHAGLLNRARLAKWVDSEKEIRFHLDEEIMVEAIPDLIFCERNNRAVIVDWKVREEGTGTARDQLHTYAFAALYSGYFKEFQVDNIELIEANLVTGDAISYNVTESDLDSVDDRIFMGVELLRPVFERPVKLCRPEDFSPANSRGACEYCSVLEVCNGSFPKKSSAQPISLELFSTRGPF